MFSIKILTFVVIISNCNVSSRAEPLAGYVDPAYGYEFPFVVSIGRKFDLTTNNPYGHTCGGALIAKRYVLTSANCFSPGKNASDYFVYIGSGDLAQSEKFKIDKWTTYDCWLRSAKRCNEGLYSENDVALVQLTDKVKAPSEIVKILSIQPAELEGKNVMTASWGVHFNDTTIQHMLKADLRVISSSECLQRIQNVSNDFHYFHTPNTFCTSGTTLFATLDTGDRGSPLFMQHENGDYRIIGVNQNSAPSVNEVVQLPDQVNKHTSVYHYVKFKRDAANLWYRQDV